MLSPAVPLSERWATTSTGPLEDSGDAAVMPTASSRVSVCVALAGRLIDHPRHAPANRAREHREPRRRRARDLHRQPRSAAVPRRGGCAPGPGFRRAVHDGCPRGAGAGRDRGSPRRSRTTTRRIASMASNSSMFGMFGTPTEDAFDDLVRGIVENAARSQETGLRPTSGRSARCRRSVHAGPRRPRPHRA